MKRPVLGFSISFFETDVEFVHAWAGASADGVASCARDVRGSPGVKKEPPVLILPHLLSCRGWGNGGCSFAFWLNGYKEHATLDSEFGNVGGRYNEQVIVFEQNGVSGHDDNDVHVG